MKTKLKLTTLAFATCLSTPALALECADGMHVFAHAAGETCIPEDPQKIAALDDLRLTLPLIELGAPLVASHGRISRVDGSQYIRGAGILTGVNFDNSDIAFLGTDPFDFEALAATSPDLIITLSSRDIEYEQLSQIAPTVMFDEDITDRFDIFRQLAEITNSQGQLEILESRYQADLAQLTRLVDAPSIKVSVIEGSDGAIAIQHTYGSLGRVLRDAGFEMPELVDALAPGTDSEISAEFLPQLDGDIIFDTFRGDRNETPAKADERMQETMSDYCAQLTACQKGNYYRIPRDEAYAISYGALSAMTRTLLTALSSSQLSEGE